MGCLTIIALGRADALWRGVIRAAAARAAAARPPVAENHWRAALRPRLVATPVGWPVVGVGERERWASESGARARGMVEREGRVNERGGRGAANALGVGLSGRV